MWTKKLVVSTTSVRKPQDYFVLQRDYVGLGRRTYSRAWNFSRHEITHSFSNIRGRRKAKVVAVCLRCESKLVKRKSPGWRGKGTNGQSIVESANCDQKIVRAGANARAQTCIMGRINVADVCTPRVYEELHQQALRWLLVMLTSVRLTFCLLGKRSATFCGEQNESRLYRRYYVTLHHNKKIF